jgi:hypothetical protein
LKIKERRLQGDVATVERLARADESRAVNDDGNQAVRDALRAVWWQRSTGDLAPAEKEALSRAEPRLVAAATRDPSATLVGLQALRNLLLGGANVSKELLVLERSLWKLLPPTQPLPRRTSESSPELSRAYFRSLHAEESKP